MYIELINTRRTAGTASAAAAGCRTGTVDRQRREQDTEAGYYIQV